MFIPLLPILHLFFSHTVSLGWERMNKASLAGFVAWTLNF